MAAIDTLRALIDDGFVVTAYCHALGCGHYSDLDLEALVGKLGGDFVAIGNPNPLVAKLLCAKCQGKDLSLRLSPEVNRQRVISAGATYAKPPEGMPPIKLRRARRRVRL